MMDISDIRPIDLQTKISCFENFIRSYLYFRGIVAIFCHKLLYKMRTFFTAKINESYVQFEKCLYFKYSIVYKLV